MPMDTVEPIILTITTEDKNSQKDEIVLQYNPDGEEKLEKLTENHSSVLIGESNVAIDPAIGGYGAADIHLGEFSPHWRPKRNPFVVGLAQVRISSFHIRNHAGPACIEKPDLAA